MPRLDKKVSKRKNSPKRVLKRSGNGGKDDDDSSVDSKGNIRDLIDYDYTSDEDYEEEDYSSSTSASADYAPRQQNSPRPKRAAAIAAQKKIDSFMRKENERKEQKDVKASKEKQKEKEKEKVKEKEKEIKKIKRNALTPKRRNPFKIKTKYQPARKRTPVSSSDSDSGERTYLQKRKFREVSSEDSSSYHEDDDYDEEEDEDYEDEELETTDEDDVEDETEGEKQLSEDEDEETDDEDYEDEDEDDFQSSKKGFGGILLALGGGGSTMTPKKYNMKKEPEIVKKFVKLLTDPVDDNSIDTQIAQFKKLDEEKQKELIVALENRPTTNDTGVNLMLKILTLKVSAEIQGMILSKYNSLQSLDTSSNEYFKLRSWLDKVTSIPFGIYKDIPVRLEDGSDKCADFMRGARKCLDDSVYGQDESKLQILQFIASKIANPESRGLSLLLIGPPGIGKTTLIKNGIAKALGWPFQFISLGGDSDASTYTGHQLVYESSHCGKIVNSLIASKSMSTVLMFDEIDKISQTPKGEEVMNLLIHLTDPVQNADFEDKYLSGVPIDLSKVMFVFSANDINKIDKILLDRMMVIDLKGYDKKQKTTIAENYLLPAALKEVNLGEKVAISKEILTNIIEEYASEEKGVRELKRSIEQITQKVNMLRMYNAPELPFYIKDFTLPFIVKKEHLKLFIKKKESNDTTPHGMYT